MKLVLSLIAIAFFSSCGSGTSSGGPSVSTGASTKFALTPAKTLTNSSVILQSITLNDDGTGTLVVSEPPNTYTFALNYLFDTGSFSSINTSDSVTVTSSDNSSAPAQISRQAAGIGNIKGYLQFVIKGAYYSVKAYFHYTNQVGGSTLQQAIDDRPQDMQYNGSATVTTPAACDPTTLDTATTATLKNCCVYTQDDLKILNHPSCQSCRTDPTCLGTATTTTTTTTTTNVWPKCTTCNIEFQANFSLNSIFFVTATANSSGTYQSSSYGCSGADCNAIKTCLLQNSTLKNQYIGYTCQ